LPEDREVEAKKAKAARLKEQKKYSEAAELWRDLSKRSQAFLEDVQEELAIYYEHRKGDLEEALRLSEHALAQLRDRATLKKWEHRRARVALKLARRKSVGAGLLFQSQS
jgi:tetratricopeptide (TPR) repeat protein